MIGQLLIFRDVLLINTRTHPELDPAPTDPTPGPDPTRGPEPTNLNLGV